jgi:hypothetical protein
LDAAAAASSCSHRCGRCLPARGMAMVKCQSSIARVDWVAGWEGGAAAVSNCVCSVEQAADRTSASTTSTGVDRCCVCDASGTHVFASGASIDRFRWVSFARRRPQLTFISRLQPTPKGCRRMHALARRLAGAGVVGAARGGGAGPLGTSRYFAVINGACVHTLGWGECMACIHRIDRWNRCLSTYRSI